MSFRVRSKASRCPEDVIEASIMLSEQLLIANGIGRVRQAEDVLAEQRDRPAVRDDGDGLARCAVA